MRSVDHGKLRGKFLTVSNPGTELRRCGMTCSVGKLLTNQKRSSPHETQEDGSRRQRRSRRSRNTNLNADDCAH